MCENECLFYMSFSGDGSGNNYGIYVFRTGGSFVADRCGSCRFAFVHRSSHMDSTKDEPGSWWRW